MVSAIHGIIIQLRAINVVKRSIQERISGGSTFHGAPIQLYGRLRKLKRYRGSTLGYIENTDRDDVGVRGSTLLRKAGAHSIGHETTGMGLRFLRRDRIGEFKFVP